MYRGLEVLENGLIDWRIGRSATALDLLLHTETFIAVQTDTLA
jgi:hypothetical protein